MVVISFTSYQVAYWASLHLRQESQVATALAAFAIGILANGYSRLRRGSAAAVMLPAVFVLVPSGLAASGSLNTGLTTAMKITDGTTSAGMMDSGMMGGYGMVQVGIAMSFGLFMSRIFRF